MMKTKLMMALSALSLLTVSCSKQKPQTENVVKVKIMEVASAPLYGGLSYSGTIEERSGISLSFPVGGTVKQLHVAEGQSVRAGQPIAVLDATTLSNLASASSATVEQARATLSQAEKSAAQALDAYKRMKLLHDNGSLPEMKWVEIQTRYQQAQDAVRLAQGAVRTAHAQKNISQKNLHDTHLYAPTSGYISKKLTEAGQNIAPGQPVAMLVDISRVKVKVSVPEDEIAQIHVGGAFRFTVSSLPGETFTARVTEKGVAADPITRSYEVKAVADNEGRKLLPGMVCDVYAEQASRATAISLPANIIQIDVDNKPFVWTVVGGVARRTPITLGQSIGDHVQIVGGLSLKDKIVVEGQQKVSNGMKVQE